MQKLWIYRFELCITLSGMILLGSVFFPKQLPHGFYVLLLILFLISVTMLKLSSINEYVKQKINQGGRL